MNIRELDLKDVQILTQILDLQREAYKIEAEIIGYNDIPPLKETFDALKKCGEIFFGYYIDDSLAGIVSYKIFDDVLDIHRVAVHPQFFRMGIADAMLDFIEVKSEGYISKYIVSTGKENLPAVKLYLKRGFKVMKNVEIDKGIYLTEFEKVCVIND